MLVFSVFVTLRGHNEPGGGFIGGLIAASAIAIYGMAMSPQATRRAMRVDPLAIAGFGYVGGMLFNYSALAGGKVPVAASIVSTEGAIGATLAVLAGDPISRAANGILASNAVGVRMASIERTTAPADGGPLSGLLVAAMLAGCSSAAGTTSTATSSAAAVNASVTTAEAMADSAVRLAPLTEADVDDMVDSLEQGTRNRRLGKKLKQMILLTT